MTLSIWYKNAKCPMIENISYWHFFFCALEFIALTNAPRKTYVNNRLREWKKATCIFQKAEKQTILLGIVVPKSGNKRSIYTTKQTFIGVTYHFRESSSCNITRTCFMKFTAICDPLRHKTNRHKILFFSFYRFETQSNKQ